MSATVAATMASTSKRGESECQCQQSYRYLFHFYSRFGKGEPSRPLSIGKFITGNLSNCGEPYRSRFRVYQSLRTSSRPRRQLAFAETMDLEQRGRQLSLSLRQTLGAPRCAALVGVPRRLGLALGRARAGRCCPRLPARYQRRLLGARRVCPSRHDTLLEKFVLVRSAKLFGLFVA